MAYLAEYLSLHSEVSRERFGLDLGSRSQRLASILDYFGLS